METVIRSPQDGTIKKLAHKEGVSQAPVLGGNVTDHLSRISVRRAQSWCCSKRARKRSRELGHQNGVIKAFRHLCLDTFASKKGTRMLRRYQYCQSRTNHHHKATTIGIIVSYHLPTAASNTRKVGGGTWPLIPFGTSSVQLEHGDFGNFRFSTALTYEPCGSSNFTLGLWTIFTMSSRWTRLALRRYPTFNIVAKDMDVSIYPKGRQRWNADPEPKRIDISSVFYEPESDSDKLFWAAARGLYMTTIRYIPQREAHRFIETCQEVHLYTPYPSIDEHAISHRVRDSVRSSFFADVVVLCMLYGHDKVRQQPWYCRWSLKYNCGFCFPKRIDGLFTEGSQVANRGQADRECKTPAASGSSSRAAELVPSNKMAREKSPQSQTETKDDKDLQWSQRLRHHTMRFSFHESDTTGDSCDEIDEDDRDSLRVKRRRLCADTLVYRGPSTASKSPDEASREGCGNEKHGNEEYENEEYGSEEYGREEDGEKTASNESQTASTEPEQAESESDQHNIRKPSAWSFVIKQALRNTYLDLSR